MGKIISRLANRFLQKCEWRIPMVGLDSSGKTTILYKLKLGGNGFNVECIEYRNVSITIWSIGGQSKIRSLWRHYFHNANGLIFVVDSNDRHRILEARNELHKILRDFELRSAIIIVFSNKQDLPNAMNVTEVAEKLGLHSLGHRSWYIQSTSAISGQGLHRGLDWLLNNISSQEA